MSNKPQTVCLISGGMVEKNIRLQPWRYLHEVAKQLAAQDYDVTVISDGYDHSLGTQNGHAQNDHAQAVQQDMLAGVSVRRLASVSRPKFGTHRLRSADQDANQALTKAVRDVSPDVILWHVGVTSFLHQQMTNWPDVPIVAILTSPIYQFGDLQRLGLAKLVKNRDLSAIHIAGTLLPRTNMRTVLNSNVFSRVVVQTETIRQKLLTQGVEADNITVIAPGVDHEWFGKSTPAGSDENENGDSITQYRDQLGYEATDKVILYYGSPAPLRGLHTLIRAVEVAHKQDESIRLLVLSRRHADQLMNEDQELRELLSRSDVQQYTQIIDGFLEPETLVEFVSSTDIIALPFELVPSDAPLSLLESKALGKPIVTTNVACLPELAAGGPYYVAEPADPHSLASALLRAAGELSITETCTERPSDMPSIKNLSSDEAFDVTASNATVTCWERVGEKWSRLIQGL